MPTTWTKTTRTHQAAITRDADPDTPETLGLTTATFWTPPTSMHRGTIPAQSTATTRTLDRAWIAGAPFTDILNLMKSAGATVILPIVLLQKDGRALTGGDNLANLTIPELGDALHTRRHFRTDKHGTHTTLVGYAFNTTDSFLPTSRMEAIIRADIQAWHHYVSRTAYGTLIKERRNGQWHLADAAWNQHGHSEAIRTALSKLHNLNAQRKDTSRG